MDADCGPGAGAPQEPTTGGGAGREGSRVSRREHERRAFVDRHRCAHCRNPIRREPGVHVPGPDGSSWFHPDCWARVLADEQQEYRRKVAELGLSALIAPYLTAT